MYSEIVKKIKNNIELLKIKLEAVEFCKALFYNNGWAGFERFEILYGVKIRTIDDLETFRKRLLTKIKNAEYALKAPAKPTAPAKISLNIKCGSPLKIDDIYVGRCEEGSAKLFRQKTYANPVYYHSAVRGGSLVVAPQQSIYAASCSLIYSKNLKTVGTVDGYVVSSKSVLSTPKKGAFIFNRSKSEYVECKPLYLHIDLVQRTAHLSFKKGNYVLKPYVTSSFLENFTNKTFNELKQLAPSNYGWHAC